MKMKGNRKALLRRVVLKNEKIAFNRYSKLLIISYMHSKCLGTRGISLIVMMGWGLCVLPACSRTKSPDNKKAKSSFFEKSSKKEKKENSVSVVTPTVKDVPITIKASGRTEISEKYDAKAAADMKVIKVFVEEGAKIQPGDPLVQFDDETIKLKLNFVRDEIKEAEAALSNVNYLIQNKEQLMKEEKVTETEAEGFDERLNWYQATADRAKAEVDLYEHTGDMSQINSPIGGIVTVKNVTEGLEVTEGQALVQVARLDPIHFVFSVSSDEAPAFSNVQSMTVKFPMIPNQDFTAEVVSVGAEVKAEAGGIPVKLKINNPDFNLKGEMVGDVMVRSQVIKKAFVIPETVLKKADKSYYVFKVEEGKARKIFVELGEAAANGSALIVKGVSEKDNLISESDGEIKDGDVVQVRVEEKQK